MTTWADVSRGDVVVLRGRRFTVEKAKRKGKRVRATVTGSGGTFTSDVRAKDAVELVPLHDGRGAQQRWAHDGDAKPAEPLIAAGDPEQRERPHKARGADWDAPTDQIEADLMEYGAVLEAETDVEGAGWYVPPPTIETIYAHMHTFHRVSLFDGEVAALAEHDELHRRALAGKTDLPVQHWHTKRRP